MSSPKHPMQPIVMVDGRARFKENKIVRFLLDVGCIDLNQIALMPFDDEDRSQFAQLIGYSVSGFGELSYAREDHVEAADKVAAEMYKEKK